MGFNSGFKGLIYSSITDAIKYWQQTVSLNNTIESDKRDVSTPNNELIIQVV